MSKLSIGTGIVPDDGLGDSLLDGAVKINSNFDDIYTYFGDGTNLTFAAFSGDYDDLSNTPTNLSDFNNDVGFITAFTSTNYWAETLVGIHTLSNVGIGTTNPIEKLTVVGVTSSTSFYGDASYATDGRWSLGASGTSDYTFTGIGFTQTTNDPILYLARGRVYEFVNNSGGSHPFEIRVSDGGAAYDDGVTNNGTASGVIRFEIPFNAPNTLYYQCTVHSGMGNTISVYPSTI